VINVLLEERLVFLAGGLNIYLNFANIPTLGAVFVLGLYRVEPKDVRF